MPASRPLEVRFWEKVKIQDDGCWTWEAARDKDGYGVFQFQGRPHGAHRFVWEWFNGPVPADKLVGHKCNIPPCVNPDHLCLQTPLENMTHKVLSGRLKYRDALPNPWARSVRRPLAERFWSRVKKTDTCWLWTGAINGDGYGHIWSGSETLNAHRLSWQLHNGEIPKGLNVLHKCDVRNCISPFHLYLGTQKENRKDADIRGRSNLPKGQDHPKTHLKNEDVDYIRTNFKHRVFTMKMMAVKFGVTKATIADIIYRRHWKHI